MTRPTLLLLVPLCLAPLACGGGTEVESYPNADDLQENEPGAGGSEPVQQALPPEESGGPYPQADQPTGQDPEPF